MIIFMYIFCVLAWGLNFIAIKIQGNIVPLEVSLCYRLMAAAAIFFILIAIRRPAGSPQRRDWPFLMLFGIFNFALSYLLLYRATIVSSSALVVLVFSLKTITTPFALRMFLKQKVHGTIFLAGAIGVAGVVFLIFPWLQRTDRSGVIEGLLFAIAGTLLTSLGDVCSARNARRSIHPLYANAYGFFAASIIILLFASLSDLKFSIEYSWQYIGALLYLTLIASCVAWIYYLRLVGEIGAATSGYMVALFPAVGGLASVAIGESAATTPFFVGCALCCLGAAISSGGPTWLRFGKVERNQAA